MTDDFVTIALEASECWADGSALLSHSLVISTFPGSGASVNEQIFIEYLLDAKYWTSVVGK